MVQQATSIEPASGNPHPRRWVALSLVTLLSLGAGAMTYARSQSTASQSNQTPTVHPEINSVTALGRLEPQGEVIKLSAPASSQGSRVEQLLVKEGDRVQAGQIIAILDNRDQLQAAVGEAEEQVRVAQSKLAQIQAGNAKVAEIAAQRANIARLEAQLRTETTAREAEIDRAEAELRNAERTYQRYQALYQEGAEKAVLVDEKRERYETSQAQLNQAKAQRDTTVSTLQEQIQQQRAALTQLSEVRPVDVEAGQAEVRRAIAALKQAQAKLDQTYVKAPQRGTVLSIHTRAGELVANEGIVELGQTQQMYAIAEVYQSDVSKVHPGQKVRVSSDSLPGELSGTVDWMSAQVRRQTVVNTDPSENIDARIVEVHVRLDAASSQKAAQFTNLQVKAVIEL